MTKTLNLFAALLVAFSFASCSKSSDDVTDPITNPKDTTNNNGVGGTTETGLNTNPDFSFYFDGQKIELSKVQADYGGKTYFMCFAKSGKFNLDMAIPMPKGVVASNKVFSIENDQYTGMGFYIDADDKKWYLEGGTINVTKNTANTMSGSFSAKALLMDYTDPNNAIRLDSVNITNGIFNNLKVKG
jgi:hypothetical protein